MIFTFCINSTQVASFSFGGFGAAWFEVFNTTFELPYHYGAKETKEALQGMLNGIEVCPYQNLVEYEPYMSVLVECLQEFYDELSNWNGTSALSIDIERAITSRISCVIWLETDGAV